MRYATALAALAYHAVRPGAYVASLLPGSLHAGKRAHRAIASLRAMAIDERFARATLESSWRSKLLHRHVSQLSGTSLQAFLESCIEYDGAVTLTELSAETRPLIFATPHYGVPIVGFIAASYFLRGCKVLKLFYDKNRYGAQLEPFFERAGIRASALLGGFAGIKAAARALERHECLALLPDAFDDVNQTVVIPFLNRLLRVAAGTAFLSRRSRALIVPAFAAPRTGFGLRVTFSEPIDPERVITDDESQALFTLTHLLFSRFEAQLRLAPEHWRYWETLPHVSTPSEVSAPFDAPQLLGALKAKFRALPPAVQNIPELELLLQ